MTSELVQLLREQATMRPTKSNLNTGNALYIVIISCLDCLFFFWFRIGNIFLCLIFIIQASMRLTKPSLSAGNTLYTAIFLYVDFSV